MNHDQMTDQLAGLLERCGLAPEEARARAGEAVAGVESAAPGTTYGHLDPQGLAGLWQRASRAGRRRLVLEIVNEAPTLEDDAGRVNVRVLEAENWPEWTAERAAQMAATGALLRPVPGDALDIPASWENAVLEMHRQGHKTVEEWEAQARTAKELN